MLSCLYGCWGFELKPSACRERVLIKCIVLIHSLWIVHVIHRPKKPLLKVGFTQIIKHKIYIVNSYLSLADCYLPFLLGLFEFVWTFHGVFEMTSLKMDKLLGTLLYQQLYQLKTRKYFILFFSHWDEYESWIEMLYKKEILLSLHSPLPGLLSQALQLPMLSKCHRRI